MAIRYPIGQQDFEKIRENGKVYIDKTALIYEIVNNNNYVFLSRPRRFGKSLVLSTIKYYFEGRKELFEGLEIENLEKEWKKYPVLYLQLARTNAKDEDSLNNILEEQLSLMEKEYEVRPRDWGFSQRFSTVIRAAYEKTGERVVILVDEYDHPLINTMEDSDLHDRNRELLKSVYSNLKEMDGYIKFGMLTGVTRFSKAGIFSGLNNISDITFLPRYSTICGFTQDEIRKFLWEGVVNLGKKEGCDAEEALNRLKLAYDGYHFSRDLTDLYNPFSVLKALAFEEISNYWIDSGTPSFLIKRLQGSKALFSRLFNEEADTTDLAAVDTAFRSPVALLYQTGYLTIKDSYREGTTTMYKLGVPNTEVREGFFSALLESFTDEYRQETLREVKVMKRCLESGDMEGFLERARSFFAGIPYHLTSKAPEIYFENNLYLILQLMGFDVRAEDETSRGRIDLSVKTEIYLYIIEIKVDQDAETALKQIEDREYALKYGNDGREVICVGVSFSTLSRNIEDWRIVSLNPPKGEG